MESIDMSECNTSGAGVGDEEDETHISQENEDDCMDSVEHRTEDESEEEPIQRKSGVLYFSSIPPKMTPDRLKDYFSRLAPGVIGRVYFERNKHSRHKDSRFLEGWLEVKRKKVAKGLAERVNGAPVGGKKRDVASSVLWNVKYLHGFKWVHLVEQLAYEKSVQSHRMQAEISQARRVAAHFEEQIEKGERLKKLEKKVLEKGGQWEKQKRDVAQRAPLKTKKKNRSKAKEKSQSDELMGLIFAE